MVVRRHFRQGGANQERRYDRPGQNLFQPEREYGQSRARFENLGYADRLDMRTDSTRFHQDETGMGGSMNVQEAEEFKTSKFFCKTDFDMKEIKKEEAAYVPLPKFYTFKSREERERILYRNFVNVGMEVKEMIKDVLNKRGAK